MRAVIYETPGSLHVGDAPDPTPQAGQVIVKVGAVGICGSDLNIANIAAGLFHPPRSRSSPGTSLPAKSSP